MKKSNRKTFIKQSAVLAATPFIGLKAFSQVGKDQHTDTDGGEYPIEYLHGDMVKLQITKHGNI